LGAGLDDVSEEISIDSSMTKDFTGGRSGGEMQDVRRRIRRTGAELKMMLSPSTNPKKIETPADYLLSVNSSTLPSCSWYLRYLR
jgi:hypothetical protein